LLNTNSQEIHQAFDLHLYNRKVWLPMKSDKSGLFTGRIIGTKNNGMLLIEDENQKIHSYNHKEIEFNSVLPPSDQP
jgi:biotin-(acetyl-CoA carboxylase) ligase